MLDMPEKIKDLYRSGNTSVETQKKFKLTFYDETADTLYPYETLFPEDTLFPAENGIPWITIENDRIESESLTITEALCDSDELEFGACEASSVEIVVADVIEDLTGRTFTLSVECGGYEMILGVYTVESYVRQSDRRKRKITAYDNMRLFDVDVAVWYNELTFPMTLFEFRNSLCEYIGISQIQISLPFDSLKIEKTIEPEQISGLEVLKAICQLNGCFGHMDRTGALKYIQLQQTGLYPSESLYPEDELYPSEKGSDDRAVEHINYYKQPLEYEDYMVDGITGLTIRQEEGDIGSSVGTSDSVYTIEGNFLVYGKSAAEMITIANTLLPYISGRTYRPASIECYAMPWIEVGDYLQAVTQTDIIETFCMKRTMSGCQAMMDTYEATGGQTREEVFGVNKQITQLLGKTAVITRNIEEVSAKVTDLGEKTEAQFKVTAEQISAEVTRATESESKLSSQITLTAESLKTQVTDSANQMQSQITQNADAIKLKVSKGNVSSEISVESGGVNIQGNRFSWNSTYSNMTADGTLTCQNIKATNGTFSGTITGSTISGGTITGATITGNTISGGTVSGATIKGSTITGSDIKASKVTATGELNLGVLSVKSIEECTYVNATRGEFSYLQCSKFTYYSDKRLKKNIHNIPPKVAMKVVDALRPVKYQFKSSGDEAIGLIAQEVETVLRENNLDWPLYDIDPHTGFYGIPYMHFIGILIACFQYLDSRLKRLEGNDD